MILANETLETVFREEYGRIIASLIRVSGSFDLAEEALQEAFIAAAERWPSGGTPDNPAAWLTTVSRRKMIDAIRREQTRVAKEPHLAYEIERLHSAELLMDDDVMGIPDDRLSLIFTCCHPALGRDAQVALTLKTLGGLNTFEIARAFLIPEATLAQRLVRAKNKIRLAGIPYQVPSREILADRLEAVQAVIYLIFNEGYSSSRGDGLMRSDLCHEAIRLARILMGLMPDPETTGLLALMLLQDARRDSRVDIAGELITLEDQNRSHWERDKIKEGTGLIEDALSNGRPGSYQIQAAIAAVHAESRSAADTDWRQIMLLYRELLTITPTPIVALNHAVAVAMSDGIEGGLGLIDEIGRDGVLDEFYLFHAARADLLRRLGKRDEALLAYTRALGLTTNTVEQNYLKRRINEVAGTNGHSH